MVTDREFHLITAEFQPVDAAGVRLTQLPMSPPRVLKAIDEEAAAKKRKR